MSAGEVVPALTRWALKGASWRRNLGGRRGNTLTCWVQRTHAGIHARTHSHPHTKARTRTHKGTHTHTQGHEHAHTEARTHTEAYLGQNTHTHVHTWV